jgi:predicted Zn-dependent protease with MMP-like domain
MSRLSLSARERARFDRLLDEVLAELPPEVRDLLEEVPVIIEDEPSAKLLREMEMEEDEFLCGLHWGVPLTQRSVESQGHAENIWLFRGPIVDLAAMESDRRTPTDDDLRDQVRITLLHEIGHHFGLDEDDLARLGYA